MSGVDRAPAEPGRLPVASGAQTRRALSSALIGRRGALLLSVVLLIGSAAAGLVAPAALGAMVDVIGSDDATERVMLLGGAMVAGALVSGLLLAVGVVIASRLAERLLADIRERMVGRGLRLPHRVVERAGSGDLVSRATDDVAEIAEVAPQVVPAVGGAAFTVLTTLVGMAVLDWRFAVAMLLIVPLHVLTMRWYLRTAPPVYRAERAANADKASRLLEALQGLDTVRAFNLNHREEHRIAVASWQVAIWSLRARIVQNRFFGRINSTEFVGTAAILVVAFWLVRDDVVSVGTATTAVLFFLRLYDPIAALLLIVDQVQSAAASLARIVGIDLVPVEPEKAPADRDRVQRDPVVALDGVHFAYEPGRPVLYDVSLSISPGEHVALVGASGAGKSTVGALLAGLRDVDTGRRTLSDESFVISQDVHMFAGTLRENLLLASPHATDEQLMRALARVDADHLLRSLPDGLDSEVGHGGHQVSAADAQHLALARVVLADPPVVILDEPSAEAGSAQSSALDRAVSKAIDGRAALVIVHRLSQAAEASRVVLMAGGRIVGSGPHDELLRTSTEYAQMWRAWESNRT